MTRFKTTNYVRGRSFEYRVKKHYEREGWLVLRTAGSHGPVDLVCLAPGCVPKLIQCKNRKPTKAEIDAIRRFEAKYADMPDGYGISVCIVYPKDRGLVEI